MCGQVDHTGALMASSVVPASYWSADQGLALGESNRLSQSLEPADNHTFNQMCVSSQ